ncbi:MAG: hypothetical protein J3R72DRAFT_493170 [Linnemannia gamsii]|nr:MAG: hypothetical protein J3R72DRAFT_493170 [Linnemannia gamsii]
MDSYSLRERFLAPLVPIALYTQVYQGHHRRGPGLSRSQVQGAWLAVDSSGYPVGDSIQGPVGCRVSSYARSTTIATTLELNNLRDIIKDRRAGIQNSSLILMDSQDTSSTCVQKPGPNQPINLLPSFLLRGIIFTNGRDVHLSAVDLRKRAHQRFITEFTINPDDRLYRQHVLAPDSRRKLPNIVTALPDALSVSSLFPDTTKVDVGALDLGMAFMTGFVCRRYDRPDFIYTIKAKTKAAYQATIKAQKEFDVVKNNATITATTGPLSAKMAINVYESSLGTLGRNPDGRIQQEDHILTAMGTHTVKSLELSRRGLILVGTGDFSVSSKGQITSLHGSFLRHKLAVLATLFWAWTNIIHGAVAPDARYMAQMKKILSGASASGGSTADGKYVYNPWYGPNLPPTFNASQIVDRRRRVSGKSHSRMSQAATGSRSGSGSGSVSGGPSRSQTFTARVNPYGRTAGASSTSAARLQGASSLTSHPSGTSSHQNVEMQGVTESP